jgi:hypothetical protein
MQRTCNITSSLRQILKTIPVKKFPFSLCSQHVAFKFSMDSHQVPNMFPRFPMCSPRVFPIAPGFNPTCFAQNPPLLTYIGGPKGEALHLFIESSILGGSIVSTFFCDGRIKLAHCKKKRSWTCEASPTNEYVRGKGY